MESFSMASERSGKKNRRPKAPVPEVSEARRELEAARFKDDVLTKLNSAFVDILQKEGWTKRDLAELSGLDETAIGHILAGRRKNLTVDVIARLARAMRTRPELALVDLRPTGNRAEVAQPEIAGSRPGATVTVPASDDELKALISKAGWWGCHNTFSGQGQGV